MKTEIIRRILTGILLLTALYSGISCGATIHRARTQPYLRAGTERFDFCGYYIMAFVNAAVCLSALVVSVLLVI